MAKKWAEAGRLTTHVLDLSSGRPAAGMNVQLYKQVQAEGAGELLCTAVTNSDGRLDRPLLEGEALEAGLYELVFGAGDYFRRKSMETAAAARSAETGNVLEGIELNLPEKTNETAEGGEMFLEEVPIRFRITDSSEHYHVPLLVAPGGYSTYRGS